MTRVLQLVTGLDPGGAEIQVASLSVELRRRGWDVAVASLLETGSVARGLAEAGVPVITLGIRAGVADPRGLARLAARLGAFRPSILHAHMFHANILARLARLVCPVPVVISTIHSAAETGRERRAGLRRRDLAYRLTGWLDDAVVAVSNAVAARHEAARAVNGRKLRVIANGVDTSLFRPDEERRAMARRELDVEDRFVWLAAGRLMWKKDHATLLRALAKAGDATLLVAGVGPLEAELRALATELSIDARFLGRRDDIPALMNAADGLALSSVVEGLPMALIEAAASGLPAVATDAGGASEIVVDGSTGFVTPVGDAGTLGAAMRRLMEMPAGARLSMSEAARREAGRFNIQTVVSHWENLYRELLENAGRWM